RWILISIDHTTKWSIARVAQNVTHEVIAKFVYDEIVLNFGCPTEIIPDRGNNFTQHMLNSYFKLIGIISDNTINKWDEYVDLALHARRIRQHHASGKTPFYMIYSVEVKLLGDEQVPIINHLVQQRDIVHQRLDSNAIKMKIYYDHRLKHHVDELQSNDWVLI
ncbi:unnamed protein product, partial [Rotaria sordida]